MTIVSKDLDALVRRLRRVRLKLGPAATRVLDILADDPTWILDRTSLDIAARTRTSDATVIRTIQALGFTGLPDLRQRVERATRVHLSLADKLTRSLRDMRPGFAGALEQVAEVNRLGLAAIRADVASGAFGAAVDLIHGAGRVVVIGSRPWSGLRAHLRWRLDDFGYDTVERDLDGLAQDGPGPAVGPGDLLIALALPPVSPSGSGILAPAWRGDCPLLVISDVPVESRAPHLVGLQVSCGPPGHLSLAGPATALVDALVLGLMTCCPEETLRRVARRNETTTSPWSQDPKTMTMVPP